MIWVFSGKVMEMEDQTRKKKKNSPLADHLNLTKSGLLIFATMFD